MRSLIGKPSKAKRIIKAKKMRGLEESSPEKAVSVVSMCKTNLSRTTGREFERAREELIHDLYKNHFKGKKRT